MNVFAACINDWPVIVGLVLAFASGAYGMAATVLFIGRQRALRALALTRKHQG